MLSPLRVMKVLSVWIPSLWRTTSQLQRNMELSGHSIGHFKAGASASFSKHFHPSTFATSEATYPVGPDGCFSSYELPVMQAKIQAILCLLHLEFSHRLGNNPWKTQGYSYQLTGINPPAGHQPETSSEGWDLCHICWRAAMFQLTLY